MWENDIEIVSIKNEGKSVITEQFIITLKTQISIYMTAIRKHVYTDKFWEIQQYYLQNNQNKTN